MKKLIAAVLVCSLLVVGCASSTMIKSNPPGTKVYIEGAYLGDTPYKYSSASVCWSKTAVELKKDGYFPLKGQLSKTEPNVFNIIMACALLIPAFWATGYPDEFNYELEPMSSQASIPVPTDK